MEIVSKIVSSNGRLTINIVKFDEGIYGMQKFVTSYDSEEDHEYTVRQLPDPGGKYSRVVHAEIEAKRIIDL